MTRVAIAESGGEGLGCWGLGRVGSGGCGRSQGIPKRPILIPYSFWEWGFQRSLGSGGPGGGEKPPLLSPESGKQAAPSLRRWGSAGCAGRFCVGNSEAATLAPSRA